MIDRKTLDVINLIIDLTFDKHCEMKEVDYHCDKLVCDDLTKMKEEIKENIETALLDEKKESNSTKTK